MYFFSSTIPEGQSHHEWAHGGAVDSSATSGDQLKNMTARSAKDFFTKLVTTLSSAAGNGTKN